MKILSLVAENVKKLVAVEIRPDGNLVQITGKNGQGKTSILDSIWWCLTGATHIQAVPIRKGATEARIRLDLGELVVTRTFRQKDGGDYTTSIEVKNADGAKFPSPQRMLDSLLDALAFDPLAFSRMEPKKQFDALRRFVPGVDFEKIDGLNAADFSARTEANRKAKEAKAAAAAIVVPEGTPEKPVDAAGLVGELEKAGQHNTAIEKVKADRESQEKSIAFKINAAKENRTQAEELRKRAEMLEGAAGALDREAAAMKKAIDNAKPVPAPIDTRPIRDKIDKASSINAAVLKVQERAAQLASAASHEEKARKLTEQIATRNTDKQKAIAAAKLPVEGLGFGEGIVTFNSVPFDQASDAEQLRASIAVAMAIDSKLRVIRVRDGSLLDEEGLQILADMANKHDMQVWIERVDSSGATGFVIEDGHLRGAPTVYPEIIGDQEVEHVEAGEQLQEVPF